MLLKQSSTAQPLLFQLIDTSDHIAGKTGASPTVTLSKSGAAFASPVGAVTEIANGWYEVAGNATDTATLGPLVLHATASGADPVDVVFNVVAFDPQSATNLGLSTLSGNVPQTGDGYSIVNSTTFGNAKLVRSATPANALGINSSGYIIGVLSVNGDIFGDLQGKVIGAGIGSIVGVGTWALDGAGAAIADGVSKTGYKLASDGLDSVAITAPTGVASNFREMLVQTWRRFFKKSTLTATQLKTYADNGTTIITTQTVSDDGTTQTQGTAA